MRILWMLLLVTAGLRAEKTLDFYFVDVEGGQATLIITPAGESMLVDTGWGGFGGRDAERILQAAKAAKLTKIDYLVVTHYHADHVGGVPQLVAKIPVGTFIDHGPSVETTQQAKALFDAYTNAIGSTKHMVVKPGDRIPLKGVSVQVVAANAEQIAKPLPGAGQPNPFCAGLERREPDATENARSIGFLLTFGRFRFVDLGDLTWNKELDLMCPNNRIGSADVYLTTHHGLDLSGSSAVVHALHPRVAIMNDGARKGDGPESFRTVKSSPGLEDIWQLHFGVVGGKDTNGADDHIANLEERCQGKSLMLSAQSDGGFTVTNERNSFQQTYKPRK